MIADFAIENTLDIGVVRLLIPRREKRPTNIDDLPASLLPEALSIRRRLRAGERVTFTRESSSCDVVVALLSTGDVRVRQLEGCWECLLRN